MIDMIDAYAAFPRQPYREQKQRRRLEATKHGTAVGAMVPAIDNVTRPTL